MNELETIIVVRDFRDGQMIQVVFVNKDELIVTAEGMPDLEATPTHTYIFAPGGFLVGAAERRVAAKES